MLDKYQPNSIEADNYLFWRKNNFFMQNDESKPPFTIIIPPPNVTGNLHLGHA